MLQNFMRLVLALSSLSLFNSLFAETGEKSFTPSGYKYPIMKISIAKDDFTDMQELYSCPGTTAAECLVDLTDQSALDAVQAQAQEKEIKEGTYTRLVLNNCPAGSTGTDLTQIQVKGSVTASFVNYTTSASEASGFAVAGTPEFTQIPWGCAGAVVKLLTPVEVAEDKTSALTLTVDLTNVVWTTPMHSSGMGGCKGINGGRGLCSAVPVVVPFVGTGVATFERYLVSHLKSEGTPELADANAAINLVSDPNNDVYYIIAQPYYSETSPSGYNVDKLGPDYNTATRSFTKNADGSIQFQTGGSAEDNRVGFGAFKRETHTGTCKNELASSPTWFYKAFKQ